MEFLIWVGILGIIGWILYRLYKKNLKPGKPIPEENITEIPEEPVSEEESAGKPLLKKAKENYIYKNGYERDGYDGRLIHRKVAFEHIYSYPKYPERFRSYNIHHVDKNKLNNSPNNLQILTRKEHKSIHGII